MENQHDTSPQNVLEQLRHHHFISRRSFLIQSGAAATAVAGFSTLLDACSKPGGKAQWKVRKKQLNRICLRRLDCALTRPSLS